MPGLAEIHLKQPPEQLHHSSFGTELREPEHGAIGDPKTDPAVPTQGVWGWSGGSRTHLRALGFNTDPTQGT